MVDFASSFLSQSTIAAALKKKVLAVENSEVSAILLPFNTAYKPKTPSPSPITGLPVGSTCTLLPSLSSLGGSVSPRWLFKVAQVFSVSCGFSCAECCGLPRFFFICDFVWKLISFNERFGFGDFAVHASASFVVLNCHFFGGKCLAGRG